ncbi:MAG: hypothetical protein PHC66_01210 [Candidatus Nanoarchaeia archaeon]|nr:hypothetical protein [Candidatus Nanoarchaeia archaeon]MDD5239112.1 hypothetical protein [Candidatus Nanoarchaeia archaeon]
MSNDGSSAYVFIGALLSEKKVFELWGAKYKVGYKETCPKDNIPAVSNCKFCPKCGTDLSYKEKVRDGIEDVIEAGEGFKVPEAKGLDTICISEDGGDKIIHKLIIGKKIGETGYTGSSMIDGFGLIDSKKREKYLPYVKEQLAKLGIKTPVKEYVISEG